MWHKWALSEWWINRYREQWYTIITYEEAKDLWLLGETKQEIPSYDWIDNLYKKLFWEIWWMTKENFRELIEKHLPQERTYEQWLLEAISYIWQDQWREESEDIYRKHFWLPTLYDK